MKVGRIALNSLISLKLKKKRILIEKMGITDCSLISYIIFTLAQASVISQVFSDPFTARIFS